MVMDMANLLKISEAASLALHTMGYLAANDRRLVTTHQIGEVLRASEAHLAKVLQRLARVGLVDSTRGAGELAVLYDERGKIETAFAELKTHLRGSGIVLRSKTPELVRQEFYGLIMAHFAIRRLMHEAALRVGDDVDRLSFTHAVRVVRRKLLRFVALSPSAAESLP